MKKISLLVIALILSCTLFSQNRPGGGGPGMSEEIKKMVTDTTGVIMGVVIDDQSGKQLEYATIAVLNPKDSSIISGGITDETGRFTVGKIPFGKLLIRIDFIGYKSIWINDKVLDKSKPVMPIGKIKIKPSAKMLEGVEITANKEMIQTNLDKKVFNVSKDLTSMGGTAVDVMQTIPSVQVDIDGNVSIRGSGNITVLVDGRPSNLTLEQIPAEMIESIEVITNPSARYDPDGISGIINVVFKQQKQRGFNGMLTANLGIGEFENKWYSDKSNMTLNLNYRYDKINVSFSYDNRSFINRFKGSSYRKTTYQNPDTNSVTISQLDQLMRGEMSHANQNFKIGMDYFMSKYTTIFFNASVGLENGDRGFDLNSVVSDNYNMPFQKYDQRSVSVDQSVDYEFAAGMKKTFETKGKELTIDLFYSQDVDDDGENIDQVFVLPMNLTYFQSSSNAGIRNTINAQIDFVTPIGNGGRLETGYKFANRQVDNEYRMFRGVDEWTAVLDSNQLNHFLYTDYLHSAYAIYSNTIFKKLKYQAGLRVENADVISDLKSSNTVYKHNYLNLFPTAHVRYEFTEKNAIQLSYSRRVSRPRTHNLNPFIDYSDRLNLQQGNPQLNPEFVNSLELSHYFYFGKGSSINTTVFYRKRTDIITRLTTLINDSTTMTTYQNIDNSTSYGAELVIGQTLAKWWKLSLTGGFYNNSYNSVLITDASLQEEFNWNARLMSIFNVGKKADFQVIFNYRSPSVSIGTSGFGRSGVGQGIIQQTYSIDFGGKVNLWKDIVQLKVRMSDVFGWWKMESETNAIGIYSLTSRQRESRMIWVGLSFKINDYKIKREKGNGDEGGEDM